MNPRLDAEPFYQPLTEVIGWAAENVTSTLCSCLSTHALMKFLHGIDRVPLPRKQWGVYSHRVVAPTHPLLRDINTRFDVPHSRYNAILRKHCADVGRDEATIERTVGAKIVIRDERTELHAGDRFASSPSLVAVNAGADKLFGTVDDVVNDLTQATNVQPLRPELYTPGTPGRAGCRNALAYASNNPKGVFLINPGANGIFDATDVPVQAAKTDANSTGNIRWFSLYDDLLATSDFFAPSFVELITGGKDGCLTRTADNLAFSLDQTLDAVLYPQVFQNVVVASSVAPTNDPVWTELGSERPLWTRNKIGRAHV